MKRKMTIGRFFILIAAVAVSAFIILTAFFHTFGPYGGRVVDAETGEPISGAVVLVYFETAAYKEAEIVHHFADAVEAVTDQNGEFTIPSHDIFLIRPLHQWVAGGTSIVFKPGYASFPKFKGAVIEGKAVSTLPEGVRVTVRLPRLGSTEERKKNLPMVYTPGVPVEKMPRLAELKRLEMNEIESR